MMESGRQRGYSRCGFCCRGVRSGVGAGRRGRAVRAGDDERGGIAAKVDGHYNALHSLEVHFVQTYTGMG